MSLICFSVLIVYNILIFDWINYVKSGVERDTKLAAAKELIAVQSQQYLETMEHHRQVYQIKHDQKHFLIGILSELENENYAEIKQVITSELELVSGACELDLSQGIISTIIEQKCKLASAKGITVDTDLYGIESIKISPVELSILLGNALDNAIEATEKLTSSQSKQITLLIKAKKGTVLISIENPTEQDVDVSDLRSTKEDPEMHGFGLLSIKNIVEKHNGELLFSCEDGRFKTTMIIRNNECPEESTMEQPQEMPYFKEDK
jgi:sensor histidine kinase regulating citrate/malate metabolism